MLIKLGSTLKEAYRVFYFQPASDSLGAVSLYTIVYPDVQNKNGYLTELTDAPHTELEV